MVRYYRRYLLVSFCRHRFCRRFRLGELVVWMGIFRVDLFIACVLDPDWLDLVVPETDFSGVVGGSLMSLCCL